MASEIYQVHTLQYRLPKLLAVAFYLLWGGFFYSMLAYVLIPTLLPLAFKNYGASGALIGLVCGSIPNFMNTIMSPVLSTSSDRIRTRWGRRIPYLLFSAPFVTVFMILVGWTPDIVNFLHGNLLSGMNADSANTLIVVLLAVFSILFQFFNLFVGNVYYYLIPDVLPEKVIGRFFSVLNVTMSLAGFVFNYFCLEYAKDYAGWVYTGVGILFLASFIPVCFCVKEGDYPPPEVSNESKRNLFQSGIYWIKLYCRECFSIRFYLVLFFASALNQVSTACRNLFNPLFAIKDLGLTEAQFGHIMGIGSFVSIFAILGCGFIIDRLHPVRIYIATGIIIIAMNAFGYFYAVDYNSFMVVGIAIVLIYSLQSMCGLPMCVALLPKDKFGQFASANSILNCLLMIVANYFAGVAVDRFGYRFMFVWDFVFTIIAMSMMMWIWKEFKRRKKAGLM